MIVLGCRGKAAFRELRTLPRIQNSRTAEAPLQACVQLRRTAVTEREDWPGLTLLSHTHFIVLFLSFMRRILCVLELFVGHHTFVYWSSDFLRTVLIIMHSIFIELPSLVIFNKPLHIVGLDLFFFLKFDYPITVFLCMPCDKCIALPGKIILITLINT